MFLLNAIPELLACPPLMAVGLVLFMRGGGIIKTHFYPCSFQLEPCPDLCGKLSVALLMAHSSYLMVLRSQAELYLWKSIGCDVFTIVTSKQRASNRIPGRTAGGKRSSLFSPSECDTQVTINYFHLEMQDATPFRD